MNEIIIFFIPNYSKMLSVIVPVFCFHSSVVMVDAHLFAYLKCMHVFYWVIHRAFVFLNQTYNVHWVFSMKLINRLCSQILESSSYIQIYVIFIMALVYKWGTWWSSDGILAMQLEDCGFKSDHNHCIMTIEKLFTSLCKEGNGNPPQSSQPHAA